MARYNKRFGGSLYPNQEFGQRSIPRSPQRFGESPETYGDQRPLPVMGPRGRGEETLQQSYQGPDYQGPDRRGQRFAPKDPKFGVAPPIGPGGFGQEGGGRRKPDVASPDMGNLVPPNYRRDQGPGGIGPGSTGDRRFAPRGPNLPIPKPMPNPNYGGAGDVTRPKFSPNKSKPFHRFGAPTSPDIKPGFDDSSAPGQAFGRLRGGPNLPIPKPMPNPNYGTRPDTPLGSPSVPVTDEPQSQQPGYGQRGGSRGVRPRIASRRGNYEAGK